jgi:hypothetical protein
MRGAKLITHLRTLLEAEPQLLQLAQRVASGSLAGTSSAAATTSSFRHLTRVDPFLSQSGGRLFSSLVRGKRAPIPARSTRTVQVTHVALWLRDKACLRACTPCLISTYPYAPPSNCIPVCRASQQFEPLGKRLCSSEPPRKGWEKFYPKNKPRRAAGEKASKGESCCASKRTVTPLVPPGRLTWCLTPPHVSHLRPPPTPQTHTRTPSPMLLPPPRCAKEAAERVWWRGRHG